MENLHILWTSDRPQTGHTMVLMYATNAKLQQWFENVEVIIWGASAELVANDKSIQDRMEIAKHAGVVFRACIACTNQYGVTNTLRSLGIDVAPMGVVLTDILKKDEKLLTI